MVVSTQIDKPFDRAGPGGESDVSAQPAQKKDDKQTLTPLWRRAALITKMRLR